MGQTVLAREKEAVRFALDNVDLAQTALNDAPGPDDAPGRRALHSLIERTLKQAPPVRPAVAADMLGLTEKTVRRWVEQGVLTNTALPGDPIRIDIADLHEVLRLVHDLREAGQTRGLLDAVWRQITDHALVNTAEFQESLAQALRGDGVVLVPRNSL